jgi:hypothetical protein
MAAAQSAPIATLLEHMSAAGQVSFAGNTFNIAKLATR